VRRVCETHRWTYKQNWCTSFLDRPYEIGEKPNMENIIAGVRKFQHDVFPHYRELFGRLASEQSPDALVITCSDSRVDPTLLTQSEPGQLFELRNAGNLVPPYGEFIGGVTATIEFAVVALQVPNIIICGHSGCGAMAELLDPKLSQAMPNVARWLGYAAVVREALAGTGALDGPNALERAVDANVLVQLANLRTHPCVAEALTKEQIKLHGWVYDIASGGVRRYDETWGQFVPL
jgi:carbonic anhydrase